MDKNNINSMYRLIAAVKGLSQDVFEQACEVLNTPCDKQALIFYLKYVDEKDDIHCDVVRDTVKGQKLEDLEKRRVMALERLKNSDEELSVLLGFLLKEAKELKEDIARLEFTKAVYEASKPFCMLGMAANMIYKDYPIKQITDCVPFAQLGDIYHFATDYLHKDILLTGEEQLEVKKWEDEGRKGYSEALLSPHKRGEKGIPLYDDDKEQWWYFGKGDEKMSNHTMVYDFVGFDLRYPCFVENNEMLSAKSFAELINIAINHSEAFHLTGLEEFYGVQELKLIDRILSKVKETKDE